MKKLLAFSFLLIPSIFITCKEDLTCVSALNEDYTSHFNYEEKTNGKYKITSLKDEYKNKEELRLYSYVDENIIVDEVNPDIFNDCITLKSVMLSKDILTVPTSLFDELNLDVINFTGSSSEWSILNIQTTVEVNEYACDEGFINYWNLYVRPTNTSNICDVSLETYNYVSSLYSSLSNRDFDIVKNYEDLAGETIEESMEYLKNLFNPDPVAPQEELPQNLTLALVVIITVIGMSSIAIFYQLKEKSIIK